MVQEVLKKETRALKMSTQWPAIGSWQPPAESIIEADPLTTTQEVAEELKINHSIVIQCLKQIGKVKNFNAWVPYQRTNKKQLLLQSVVFFYSVQQQWTISPSNCDLRQKVNFIWQLTTTSSVAGLKRSFKALTKAKLAPKKPHKSHGHCLLVCFCPDPLQLSESQWNHYIWEVCSANQWSKVKWNESRSALSDSLRSQGL